VLIDEILISYKYSTSNIDVLAPHIYNATGERPQRPIGETLRPPSCLVAKRTRRAVTFRIATPKSNSHKRWCIQRTLAAEVGGTYVTCVLFALYREPFFPKLKNVGAGPSRSAGGKHSGKIRGFSRTEDVDRERTEKGPRSDSGSTTYVK
jgi:hypothetical protein